MADSTLNSDVKINYTSQPTSWSGLMIVLGAIAAVFLLIIAASSFLLPSFLASVEVNGIILSVLIFTFLLAIGSSLNDIKIVTQFKSNLVEMDDAKIANTGAKFSSILIKLKDGIGVHDNEINRLSASEFGKGQRYMAFFTGSMVTLGLIGTFIGLSAAVSEIGGIVAALGGEGDAYEKVTQLFGSLAKPLEGMGTAFGTSLIGVMSSLISSAVLTIYGYAININTDQIKGEIYLYQKTHNIIIDPEVLSASGGGPFGMESEFDAGQEGERSMGKTSIGGSAGGGSAGGGASRGTGMSAKGGASSGVFIPGGGSAGMGDSFDELIDAIGVIKEVATEQRQHMNNLLAEHRTGMKVLLDQVENKRKINAAIAMNMESITDSLTMQLTLMQELSTVGRHNNERLHSLVGVLEDFSENYADRLARLLPNIQRIADEMESQLSNMEDITEIRKISQQQSRRLADIGIIKSSIEEQGSKISQLERSHAERMRDLSENQSQGIMKMEGSLKTQLAKINEISEEFGTLVKIKYIAEQQLRKFNELNGSSGSVESNASIKRIESSVSQVDSKLSSLSKLLLQDN